MNIKQLKELIKDLPDDLLIEVNIVEDGEYYDTDIAAHVWEEDDVKVLVITVGDSE